MNSTTINVLIAEDSDLIQKGLTTFLKRFPEIEIVGHASNGDEAIALCEELKPHVVLMDLKMPRKDGIEATRQIKRNNQIKTRVLILTSFSDDEDVFGAFASGADGYCLKSITMERLFNAIKAVSGGVVWLDPVIADRVLSNIRSLQPQGKQGEILDFDPGKPKLNSKEQEIVKLLSEGADIAEISKIANLSMSEVNAHLQDIFGKLSE